jgi:hypothetical protein
MGNGNLLQLFFARLFTLTPDCRAKNSVVMQFEPLELPPLKLQPPSPFFAVFKPSFP